MTAPRERDQILHWLEATNIDRLAGADARAVADTLLHLMQAAEPAYPRFDEDRLARHARIVRSARPEPFDATVVQWLAAKPSPARLDIASVVLDAFWHPAFGVRAPDPTLVETLLAARDVPGVTEEGDSTYARALIRAFEAGLPKPVGDRVLDALARVLRRPNANPALHPSIRRTLESAGRVA
jgi:hypothetical protein